MIRHPMAYGDVARQAVQRFATLDDLDRADVTVEEREEYEPHISRGSTVYAGVDYAAVLAAAERDADHIIWDGGNNDFPFIRPDLHIVVGDPLRPLDRVLPAMGYGARQLQELEETLRAGGRGAGVADGAPLG